MLHMCLHCLLHRAGRVAPVSGFMAQPPKHLAVLKAAPRGFFPICSLPWMGLVLQQASGLPPDQSSFVLNVSVRCSVLRCFCLEAVELGELSGELLG